jgi:GNAT superfamily N-acetyltransferase
MRSGEAAAVRSLVLAGLAEHWGSVDPSLNPDLDDLAAAHPGSRTVVAVDPAGTIVGTGTIVPSGTATAEVVRMSVATSLRGAGVGRQVLDALVEVARSWGVHRLVLETTADWSGTVAFYERCVAVQPPMVNALMNLAIMYEDREEFAASERCLRQVLDTYPNHPRARLFMKDVQASREMVIEEEQDRDIFKRKASEKPALEQMLDAARAALSTPVKR